VIMICLLPA